jgi:hypothetical protein
MMEELKTAGGGNSLHLTHYKKSILVAVGVTV